MVFTHLGRFLGLPNSDGAATLKVQHDQATLSPVLVVGATASIGHVVVEEVVKNGHAHLIS